MVAAQTGEVPAAFAGDGGAVVRPPAGRGARALPTARRRREGWEWGPRVLGEGPRVLGTGPRVLGAGPG